MTTTPGGAFEALPLTPGARGPAVRDLQRRLVGAGYDVPASERGVFGPATEAAVEAFQTTRGLRATGVCDAATWAALVEAGWALGDRLLYLRAPMLRGDDVAALQRKLSALGFDTGRVDGIFGPDTERALKDFQRNAGLTCDGVCGREVLTHLERLGPRVDDAETVAGVRERELLRRAPRALAGQLVAVGDDAGVGAVSSALTRALREAGAEVLPLAEADPSIQAKAANDAGAAVFVGIAMAEQGPCRVFYYATEGFESAGGQRLAAQVVLALRDLPMPCAAERGMRLPILRETRMPAVVCELGPATEVVPAVSEVATALATAVARWAEAPVEA